MCVSVLGRALIGYKDVEAINLLTTTETTGMTGLTKCKDANWNLRSLHIFPTILLEMYVCIPELLNSESPFLAYVWFSLVATSCFNCIDP